MRTMSFKCYCNDRWYVRECHRFSPRIQVQNRAYYRIVRHSQMGIRPVRLQSDNLRRSRPSENRHCRQGPINHTPLQRRIERPILHCRSIGRPITPLVGRIRYNRRDSRYRPSQWSLSKHTNQPPLCPITPMPSLV